MVQQALNWTAFRPQDDEEEEKRRRLQERSVFVPPAEPPIAEFQSSEVTAPVSEAFTVTPPSSPALDIYTRDVVNPPDIPQPSVKRTLAGALISAGLGTVLGAGGGAVGRAFTYGPTEKAEYDWARKIGGEKAAAEMELERQKAEAQTADWRARQAYWEKMAAGAGRPKNTLEQYRANYEAARAIGDTQGMQDALTAIDELSRAARPTTTKEQAQADLRTAQASGDPAAIERAVKNLQELTVAASTPKAENLITLIEKAAQGDVNAQAALDKYTETQKSIQEARGQGLGITRLFDVHDTWTGTTYKLNPLIYEQLRRENPDRFTSPSFDEGVRASIAGAVSLVPKKAGEQIQSYGTFIRHAGALYNVIGALKNSGIPWLNQPINKLRNMAAGDPIVAEFLARLEPVRDEYSRFLIGGYAMHDIDRQNAEAILDLNKTPEQMYAVVQAIAHTGTARLEELANQYQNATGRSIGSLLSPEAAAELKKMGVALPVPRPQPVPGWAPQPQSSGFRVTFTGPDGRPRTARFPSQAAADEFKRKAGIR